MRMSPELHHVASCNASQLWLLPSRYFAPYFAPQVIVSVQDLLLQVVIETLLQDLAARAGCSSVA